jgi:hypothetical protein
LSIGQFDIASISAYRMPQKSGRLQGNVAARGIFGNAILA